MGNFSPEPEPSKHSPAHLPNQDYDPQRSAHQRILHFLKSWAANHPAPDQPALSVANLGEYSPREICEAVEARSDAGRFIESLVQFGAARHEGGLEGVLQSFVQENQSASSGIDRLLSETPK